MYDADTRRRARELMELGLSVREVSRRMGGRPSATCLDQWRRQWFPGVSRRGKPVALSAKEKNAAVMRVVAGEDLERVAAEVGCAPGTLRAWRRAFALKGQAGLMTHRDARERCERISARDLPDDVELLKAMVVELRFEADLARQMLEIVKKDPGADPAALSNREKTLLVEALRPRYSPTFSMRRLRLPASTYYDQRKAMAGADRDGDIRAAVVDLFEASGRTWGYRRVKAGLDEDRGLAGASEKRVRRVMSQEGLRPVSAGRARAYRSYDAATDTAGPEVPNVPLRPDGTHDFSAGAPNVLWVSDVTEFRLPDDPRRVYLSPVLDCCDGSVVGWKTALSASSAELTDPALAMACAGLRPGDAPTCHTDRGAHYHARSWIGLCRSHGVSRSMSRKGRSPDNARMEGFFGTLKAERFHGRDWSGWSAEDFAAEVDSWIVDHNTRRKKLSLGWRTPMEYRQAALNNAA